MTNSTASRTRRSAVSVLTGDLDWYRDAVIYELHVRAFNDSNGDGTGDFAGLTASLEYLQDLGITAIWLLPFYPSPLRDDGYDIADYGDIHPAYGTLTQFRTFLRAAHARGIRVITELVLNHTSDQHRWFQRARTAPAGSVYRNYYVWSDTAREFADARVIFQDFERSNWTWDPEAQAYFWHRFYSHQPDLNYDSPVVRKEMLKVVDFWLAMGVDGLRLDATPYLFEREGTNCENLPESHAFLRELRAHIDAHFPGRMLLAEANQWPEEAAAYYGEGNECHMAFHFPLMPRLFIGVRMEDRFPITDILDQTPVPPDPGQWALFLRNHDELTLEMVTDEERDYMYRVYAANTQARINLGIRRRLAPLLGNNRRLIELMNALLLSLAGTPVLYYGDEIGMGDNIYLGDRDGVRTPMQWSADRNAGFSTASSQRLYLPVVVEPPYHYESVNVEAQAANPSQLLPWMKRLIALRRRHPAFSRGSLTIVESDNRRVLSFVREYGDERLLVVANLSRFVQFAQLSLPADENAVPIELFGQIEFPPIGSAPYFLSMGPHSFYWFRLAQRTESTNVALPVGSATAGLRVTGSWDHILDRGQRRALEAILGTYVPARRWFAGKARQLTGLTVRDAIRVPDGRHTLAALLTVQAQYTSGEPELYSLLVSAVPEAQEAELAAETPWAVIAPLQLDDGTRLTLVDALAVPRVASQLLARFRDAHDPSREPAALDFTRAVSVRRLRMPEDETRPALIRSEQSNTSVLFGHHFILKFVRRLESGTHLQVEVGQYLKTVAAPVPELLGWVDLVTGDGGRATIGILESMVPHSSDAWSYALDEIDRFFEHILAEQAEPPTVAQTDPFDAQPIPEELRARADSWLAFVADLGTRTANLHASLAAGSGAFQPERYSRLYQRGLEQGFRAHARETVRLLRQRLSALTPTEAALARDVLDREADLTGAFAGLGAQPLLTPRTRGHGDLHLGQVLLGSGGPVFIDFEGEPARSFGERRIKRTPMRDVAGMLRSLHYAAQSGLRNAAAGRSEQPDVIERLERWADVWYFTSATAFVRAYLDVALGAGGLFEGHAAEMRYLCGLYILDKALYEVRYELESRPDWVGIPLRGVLAAIKTAEGAR